MKKLNRIMMATVSILLSLVLMSTCIVSGVFARYAIKKGAKVDMSFKKWGITIEPGSDVAATYTMSDDTVVIQAKTDKGNAFAPGTNGCLAWFKVKADNPEVKFELDFSGSATIGNGYSETSELIKDYYGNPVTYFPIILILVAYDIDANGNIVQVVEDTNKDGKAMNFTLGHRYEDSNKQEHGIVGYVQEQQIYSFKTFANIEKWIDGTSDGGTQYTAGLNSAFDKTYSTLNSSGVNESFNRIYTVQWCWPYNANDPDCEYPRSEYKPDGAYQNREYDTQIGEAIAKDLGNFSISIDMSLTVNQVQ